MSLVSLEIRKNFYTCPNPLYADPYSKCPLDCVYCFVKQIEAVKEEKPPVSSRYEELKKKIESAFKSEERNQDPVIQALRSGQTVIIGRFSEPLCRMEEKKQATAKLVRLLDDFGIPCVLETKGRFYPEFINMIREVDEFGINLSILPRGEHLHERLEPRTPTYEERWNIAKRLRSAGFWVNIKCEPLIAGLNTEEPLFKRFAFNAAEASVNHVTWYGLQIYNREIAKRRFEQENLPLERYLQLQREKWVQIGKRLRKTLAEEGIANSTKDWIHFDNDTISCCGFDGTFPIHKFNWQYAKKKLKSDGKVVFSDIKEENVFGKELNNEFKQVWNRKSTEAYTLADLQHVNRVKNEENGNFIYTID